MPSLAYELMGRGPDDHYKSGWNAAIEAAAKTALANGDHLEIHSPRIAEAIRALKK